MYPVHSATIAALAFAIVGLLGSKPLTAQPHLAQGVGLSIIRSGDRISLDMMLRDQPSSSKAPPPNCSHREVKDESFDRLTKTLVLIDPLPRCPAPVFSEGDPATLSRSKHVLLGALFGAVVGGGGMIAILLAHPCEDACYAAGYLVIGSGIGGTLLGGVVGESVWEMRTGRAR